ncbi:hypothetical protein [Nostoc sp. 'Peltigera malacea cyanobiont' DB3992]|uniref:hypothetical protein n=1 Tax=Nostoc sp. 'Peltigera malacea cyanobiont' DB3992 TaxID=1206980 RepID=UPI001180380C|nr:hypothetical protein [Nostoc sp. 'Peltigera malacea cyanobiont' DB3992]
MKRVKTIDIENLQPTREMLFGELTIEPFLEELTAEEMECISGGEYLSASGKLYTERDLAIRALLSGKYVELRGGVVQDK